MSKTYVISIMLIFLMSCIRNEKKIFNSKVNAFEKDTIIHNIVLVKVPAGRYKRGLNCEQDSIPYNFWIGKYEITNKEFHKFIIDALKCNFLLLENGVLQYHYKGNEYVPAGKYRVKMFDDRIYLKNGNILLNEEFSNHPVISVTWYGAKAFCDFYGFDLPTEAEWEKAARGSECFWFPWGNEIDSSYANYLNSNDPYEPSTTPVGFYNGTHYRNFKTNNAASVFGCYDMAGNAWEWTNSRFPCSQRYNYGKGGSFNLHLRQTLQIYFISTFSVINNDPPLDICHLSDGFRIVKKI